jgi:hypothetical protein
MLKCITCKWFEVGVNNRGEGKCQLNPTVIKNAVAKCSEQEKRNKFDKIAFNIKARTKRTSGLKITEKTTYKDLEDFFKCFVVTGLVFNTKKRFKLRYVKASSALSINLWRGRVYGVRKDGVRQVIKTVTN